LLLAVVLVLQDNEVTNKRLMKIFKDKTREFRETVNQLFGWRVDYTEERSVKRYRLKSMYAEKDADELVFQKTSKSDLELMATDFSWYTKTPAVCRVVSFVMCVLRVSCCSSRGVATRVQYAGRGGAGVPQPMPLDPGLPGQPDPLAL
jgi:hypothetical protein